MRATVAALSFVVAFVTPRLAEACSCTPPPREQQFEKAGVVFLGRVTEATQRERKPGSAEWTFRFEVEGYYKGQGGAKIEVDTTDFGRGCGQGFTVGMRYIVFASGPHPRYSARACGGTMAVTSETGGRPGGWAKTLEEAEGELHAVGVRSRKKPRKEEPVDESAPADPSADSSGCGCTEGPRTGAPLPLLMLVALGLRRRPPARFE